MYHNSSYASIFLIIMVLLCIFAVVSYVITGLMLSNVAKEQGRDNGFLGWIPLANTFLLIVVAGGNPWVMLLILASFLPYIGIICSIAFSVYILVMVFQLGKKYIEGSFTGLFVAGIFISPCMLVLYWKIYKAALNKLNGSGHNKYVE